MPRFEESNFYPDTSPGYLLRVIQQMNVAGLEDVLAGDALNATQWMALISIHFGFGDTCATLARSMAHDKGAMTRLIDEMERRGWVTRTRAKGDRRVVSLALTDGGREVTMAARRKVIACWNHWLKDWSAAEVDALIATLTRLRRSIEGAGPCVA